MNIEDLFKQGPLEGIVSGCIRDTITAHGPINRDGAGSASKRIVAAFRGRVLDSFRSEHEKLPAVAQSEQILQLQKEVAELTNQRNRAQKQERRWRQKCVDNGIPLGDESNAPNLNLYANTIKVVFEQVIPKAAFMTPDELFQLVDADTMGEILTTAQRIEAGSNNE